MEAISRRAANSSPYFIPESYSYFLPNPYYSEPIAVSVTILLHEQTHLLMSWFSGTAKPELIRSPVY